MNWHSTQQDGDKESKESVFLPEVNKQLTDNPGMFENIQGNLSELFFDLQYEAFVYINEWNSDDSQSISDELDDRQVRGVQILCLEEVEIICCQHWKILHVQINKVFLLN